MINFIQNCPILLPNLDLGQTRRKNKQGPVTASDLVLEASLSLWVQGCFPHPETPRKCIRHANVELPSLAKKCLHVPPGETFSALQAALKDNTEIRTAPDEPKRGK